MLNYPINPFNRESGETAYTIRYTKERSVGKAQAHPDMKRETEYKVEYHSHWRYTLLIPM